MISVILPTYNNERTIFDSIQSILNQSYQNFELIIVNDCSKDNTKKVIKSFDDSRIVYLENDRNIGRPQSRNKGLEKAKGNFIATMDGDDIAVPERLEIQLNYLTNNPNIDLVASNIIYFTKNKVAGISDLKMYEQKKFKFLYTFGLPHPTWMAQAKFFENLNYDPKMVVAQDQDLLLRAHYSCKFTLLKEPLVFFRIPEKINIKYKLNQTYHLLLARTRYIHYYNLFYYYPLILISFIRSTVSLIFRLKTFKIITTSNLKYQSLFDKITNKVIK